ncbi:HAMP domain-containing histidine kinase [Desulfoplanes formicivorans]|uniref:Histidine kinase n=1 Tax=Desulfoplanes formicivorans TaxID=1592317 RepID=A0A194AI11_9BACT|nr:HAMP domain-containing histidine kinase [Desulfoplanes formicivorans]GAU08404.1 histidine kinase [Desulfoplanes formicivorans]
MTTSEVANHACHQKDELAFFGRMCASISHEIKNCLAVINEQNGLHEDLLMLQQQGRELPVERVLRINQTIGEQVQRMDCIVKRLNRFAHSPDHVEERIDLGELCAYVLELCRRFATNRGVVMTCEADAPVVIKAQPFLVMHLLVTCLEHLLSVVASGETIALQVVQDDQGPIIAIRPGLEHTPVAIQSLAVAVGAVVEREDGGDKAATRLRFRSV